MNLEFSVEAQNIGNGVFLVKLVHHEYNFVCNNVRFEKIGTSCKVYSNEFSVYVDFPKDVQMAWKLDTHVQLYKYH